MSNMKDLRDHVENLFETDSDLEFIKYFKSILLEFPDQEKTIDYIKKICYTEKRSKIEILLFTICVTQKTDILNINSFAFNLIAEKKYLESFIISSIALELIKNDGDFVIDTCYNVIMAASKIGLEETVRENLDFVNSYELIKGSINERKSKWIFDYIRQNGIAVDENQYPNICH